MPVVESAVIEGGVIEVATKDNSAGWVAPRLFCALIV
jgi:hypothetical protein